MPNPLISVIIPVYNVEKYLHECVDSILAQTYTNLEIILVDDGSTDASGKICDEYAAKDLRIRVIHQVNQGVSAARNAGIRAATSSLISFVDGDDWTDKRFVETLYNTLEQHSTQVACVGYCEVDKQGSHPVSVLTHAQQTEVVSGIKAVEMGFAPLGFFAWNKLFVKTLFEKIKFPQGSLFEDMATVSKLFLETDKVAITNDALYYYNRLNTDSITKKRFSVKKLDYFKASDEILNYANRINNRKLIYIIKQERAYHIAGFFRQMAAVCCEEKDVVKPLQRELRRNIGKLLISHHKLTNKLFALACCINFKLACSIYRKIGM